MKSPSAPAIYARISLDSEGDGKAIKRQLEDCRDAVASRDWPFAHEYVDSDISGYSGKLRPEYERMLVDITSGHVDAVVCYNLDRLTRQPTEFERFNEMGAVAFGCDFITSTGDVKLRRSGMHGSRRANTRIDLTRQASYTFPTRSRGTRGIMSRVDESGVALVHYRWKTSLPGLVVVNHGVGRMKVEMVVGAPTLSIPGMALVAAVSSGLLPADFHYSGGGGN